ncbi:MAG: hypothetical protein H0W90_08045 [Actinobacteria bacterium]|nr:hypothetical protein [Actinomycetota bacterium]
MEAALDIGTATIPDEDFVGDEPSDTVESVRDALAMSRADVARGLQASDGVLAKLQRDRAEYARDVQTYAVHYLELVGVPVSSISPPVACARANLSAGRPRATRRTSRAAARSSDPDEPAPPLGGGPSLLHSLLSLPVGGLLRIPTNRGESP